MKAQEMYDEMIRLKDGIKPEKDSLNIDNTLLFCIWSSNINVMRLLENILEQLINKPDTIQMRILQTLESINEKLNYPSGDPT